MEEMTRDNAIYLLFNNGTFILGVKRPFLDLSLWLFSLELASNL